MVYSSPCSSQKLLIYVTITHRRSKGGGGGRCSSPPQRPNFSEISFGDYQLSVKISDYPSTNCSVTPKMHQIRFRPGFCPGHRWESLQPSPLLTGGRIIAAPCKNPTVPTPQRLGCWTSYTNHVCDPEITSPQGKVHTAVVNEFTYLVRTSVENVGTSYHTNIFSFVNIAMKRLDACFFGYPAL